MWDDCKERVEKEGRTETRVRKRFLWKGVDYRRQDHMSVMDVFPFITVDRDREKNYRRFSFIGPVLRRTRLGEKVEWRILGLRAGEKIELDGMDKMDKVD